MEEGKFEDTGTLGTWKIRQANPIRSGKILCFSYRCMGF